MFSQRHLGRHYFGYSQRQAVGRDQKNDIVDLVGRRIVAVSLIPDDIGNRKPVQHSDDAADNRRRGQNASLHNKIRAL